MRALHSQFASTRDIEKIQKKLTEASSQITKVQRIGIRTSVVRTRRGVEISVPNSQLVSDSMTNWTLSDQLRRVCHFCSLREKAACSGERGAKK